MEENKAYRLARIIVEVRLRDVSAEDREYLNDWLDESAENRATYRRIVRGECVARRLREEERLRTTTDYAAVEGRIVRMLNEGRRRRLSRLVLGGSGAAACLVGALLGISLLRPQGEVFEPVVAEEVLAAASVEGEHEAVLVLGDGSTVDLYGAKPEIRQAGVAVVGGEGRLEYREEGEPREGTEEEREVLNRVVTGRRGYALRLGDGTRVWLNGESELEYPVRFGRGERTVRLRGEAYFEVARDAGRPFVVRTERLYTRVLGTSFNVKAYPEEGEARATLLEGKVEVAVAQEGGMPAVRRVLEPGMEVRVAAGEAGMEVRKVVAEDAVAWREGRYVFTDEGMEAVLHTLARWYGVTFVREGAGRSYTFSGMVGRGDRLEDVLEMLTLAGGPRFVMRDDRIYVEER